MKNTPLLTVLMGILFFYSCSKENSSPGNTNGVSLPKTYTEDLRSSVIGNSLVTYNLTYDNNNRMVSMVAIPDPPILKFIYQYVNNSSFTLDLYNSDVLSIHEILWLNNNSLLDSTYQYNDTNDTSTEKYIYNANKQLIQENTYDYHSSGNILSGTTNYTYDNNGNMTKQVDDQGNTITNDYYSNIQNVYPFGQVFTSQSKNMVKTSVLTNGGYTETTTHYYTFDNSNRLIKDSTYSSGATEIIAIKSYTY